MTWELKPKLDSCIKELQTKDIVLSETYLALGTNWQNDPFYVSRLHISRDQCAARPAYSGEETDVDLLVVDRQKNASYLFRIFHTNQISPEQAGKLWSRKLISYISKHFAPVQCCAVLYTGPDTVIETDRRGRKVACLNVEEFLREICKMSTQVTKDIDFGTVFHGLE